MKYKIIEVNPTSIFVEFENKSTALVQIRPDSTLEEIDHEVSNYDPEFLPKPETLINPNINVGETRISKKIENKPVEINSEDSISPPVTNISFGSAPAFDVILLSEYFSSQGDTRLKDVINEKIEELIAKPDFSIDRLISDFNYNVEDIMKQAEEELNAEQS